MALVRAHLHRLHHWMEAVLLDVGGMNTMSCDHSAPWRRPMDEELPKTLEPEPRLQAAEGRPQAFPPAASSATTMRFWDFEVN